MAEITAPVRSKVTDGPWQSLSDHDPFTIIGNVDGGYGDTGEEVHYTTVCEVSDNADAPANAALIVAAPKLLFAAKVVLDLMRRQNIYPDERGVLLAAIKKAESR